MNDRPTPETDAQTFCRSRAKGWIAPGKYAVDSDFSRKLERERDESREQNAAIRDALRVRIEHWDCPDCGVDLGDTDYCHAETCRHYQTEREVMQ